MQTLHFECGCVLGEVHDEAEPRVEGRGPSAAVLVKTAGHPLAGLDTIPLDKPHLGGLRPEHRRITPCTAKEVGTSVVGVVDFKSNGATFNDPKLFEFTILINLAVFAF